MNDLSRWLRVGSLRDRVSNHRRGALLGVGRGNGNLVAGVWRRAVRHNVDMERPSVQQAPVRERRKTGHENGGQLCHRRGSRRRTASPRHVRGTWVMAVKREQGVRRWSSTDGAVGLMARVGSWSPAKVHWKGKVCNLQSKSGAQLSAMRRRAPQSPNQRMRHRHTQEPLVASAPCQSTQEKYEQDPTACRTLLGLRGNASCCLLLLRAWRGRRRRRCRRGPQGTNVGATMRLEGKGHVRD